MAAASGAEDSLPLPANASKSAFSGAHQQGRIWEVRQRGQIRHTPDLPVSGVPRGVVFGRQPRLPAVAGLRARDGPRTTHMGQPKQSRLDTKKLTHRESPG